MGGNIAGSVSKRTEDAVGIVALWYSAFWIYGGVVATLGFTSTADYYFGATITYIVGALWLLFAWKQYRKKTAKISDIIIGLVVHHLASFLYLAFVVGLSGPFVYTWALMLAASGMYFGLRGGMVSGLVLLISIVLADSTPTLTAETALMFAGIILLGSVTAYVIRQAQRDQQDLDESHEQASLQRDQTVTLINNLADAVLSTDQNGKIILYNAAALNLLDTNSDLEGKNVDEVLPLRDADGENVSLADELYETTIAQIRDDLVTLISGEPARLELSYSPIRHSFEEDGDEAEEIGGFVIIIRDITKSKSLEEERDEFISVVSHELRTPITIAEGTVSNAQVMLGRSDIPADKVKSAIDMAHDQIVFLARMVNDLSTLSRAERGVADESEDIDVNELVKALHREYGSEAEAKNLKFDVHVPPKIGNVSVSRLYLKELLQNFVTNAIKYTAEGSITLNVTKDDNNQVTFSVSDTGIGISQADQKRIFEKFYRAEDYRTRENSGTGLGLYVSAKLARKLGTDIVMRSRLNHGSTFSITLPLTDNTKEAEKPNMS